MKLNFNDNPRIPMF